MFKSFSMRRFTLALFATAAIVTAQAQTVSDFENLVLPKADTFYENSTIPGVDLGFNSGLARFPYVYDTCCGGYGSWNSGFTYSNVKDSVTSGFGNMYAAKAGTGYNGSNNYIIANGFSGMPNFLKLTGAAEGKFAKGFYVTNSTYAYNSMRDGDFAAKKFGGSTGNDADWFKLVVRGYNKGVEKADSVEVYLADYRFTNNADDYMLRDWTWVNLLPLGKVDSLSFSLSSSDMGMWGMNTPATFCIDNFTTQEDIYPYAPQANVTGSTAIAKTNTAIASWANKCTVQRGWMDIADKAQGLVTAGDTTLVTGVADNTIMSLGDSGIAVVTFESKIYNGTGPDFAVFENGFANPNNPEEAFLELAFVEVSSDGINYFRFPASCYIDTVQIPVAGVYSNARQINNLAGKYISGFGTPFDLEELKGTAGLDVDNISHIRIVDAIGSIGGNGARDKDGRRINDPYTTAIPSGGFDLDAVAAMYLKPTSVRSIVATDIEMLVYPNPASNVVTVSIKQLSGTLTATVTDVTGKTIQQHSMHGAKSTISLASLQPGMYYLVVADTNGNKWVEKITKL